MDIMGLFTNKNTIMLKQLLRLFGFGGEQEIKSVVKYPKLVMPKGKLVAKKVYGYDADFMYGRGTTEPGLCPVCHNSLKKIPNPDYRMKKRKGDMFYTYDSFCIVSEKFKSFCELNEYEGLAFTSLPKSPGYYYFEAKNIFKLDIKDTKFTNKRECCGCYDEIIHPSSYKAKEQHIATDDFICRTEYCYDSYYDKSPVLIVGTKTALKMKDAGLSGLFFKNVLEKREQNPHP